MTLSNSAIFRTFSLEERLAFGRPESSDPQKGERRLRGWSSDPPFSDGDFFDRRLSAAGADRETLKAWLGASDDDSLSAESPWWAKEFAECSSSAIEGEELLDPPRQWRGLPSYRFWNFTQRIFHRSFRELLSLLESLQPEGRLPWRREALSDLIASTIPFEALNWPMATLVLELNVARLRGELAQDSAKDRFEAFVQGLGENSKAIAIFEEYPLLARQLVSLAEIWRRNTFEVLSRLQQDWPHLCEMFPGLANENDDLRFLHSSAGDRHCGGRSVTILGFRSGRKLVYKPRSLATDVIFQKMLQEINGWGDHPAFRTLTVLDRGSHGWVEHVAAEPCQTVEQVRRFYQRQGGYLAILHMLRATDIHFENVIAQGENPIIIDLESLLQPGSPMEDSLVDDFLRESIVQVGLLPVRNWANENSVGLDVSGLSGPGGQLPPRPEPFWANRETDEMRFDRQMQEIKSETRHRPKLEGDSPSATEHLDDIVQGFAALYRTLMSRRQELFVEEGWLSQLLRQKMRIMLRPTAIYGLMLRESFHPDCLRDGLDRDRFFDKLWKQVPQRPVLARVIGFEQDALRRADIPYFTALPTERNLYTDSGVVLDGFFTKSAVEMLAERLDSFSEKDLRQQIWFIRASVAILSTTNPERAPTKKRSRAVATPWSQEHCMALALKIGHHLQESSSEEEDSVRWLGLQPAPLGAIRIARTGNDLYSGQAGIALFLAYLGEVLGDGKMIRLAEKAASTLVRELAKGIESKENQVLLNAGAFSGIAGVAYTLHQLAGLWHRSDLAAEAQNLLSGLPALIELDERLDVLGGCAGALLVLAGLRRQTDSDTRDNIERWMDLCGERLLLCAQPVGGAVGWPTSQESDAPLAGFSHGNAGIAAALLELAAVRNKPALRATVDAALLYERRLFRAEQCNWPDLRVGPEAFDQVNWCHGAPGIGLSRILMMRHLECPELQQELRAAATTTLAKGFGRSHSLCHGDLGNLDFLQLASEVLPDLELGAKIHHLGGQIIQDIETSGWRCGLPMEAETPGLMVGVAGIGYGLLRLAEPRKVPCILALEMPEKS